MLNSQLQPSSQHQQLLASDNGNAPGYFIFDDLTTALQERSNNDQSAIAHQPLLQQHQQKYLFGELSQKINKKKKMKNQKNLHVYPLYAPTSFYITIDHDHVLFHRWIFCIKK